MKKVGTIFILISFTFITFSLSCNKELEKEAIFKAIQLVGAEIDTQEIINLTGVQFKILKTETIGYEPLHRFYWVCLLKKANSQKVNELSDAIIKEILVRKPKTYHSVTIHFFLEDELAERVESSKSFARANFLPEGEWVKVGRASIDDYKSYRIICTILE